MSRRELDEDDVRVRPTRRSSRPRSKTRPTHNDAIGAMVILVDRGRITCAVDDDPNREVVAVKARELGRKAVAVGDKVGLIGDLSGRPDTLVRLVRIDPRRSELRRTADDDDPYERIIVANVDLMGIVVALADPPPRTGLIDRCLIAAFDAGVEPLLILTKSDLGNSALGNSGPGNSALGNTVELRANYQQMGVAAFLTRRGEDIAGDTTLATRLRGNTSVFVGHSGVGKSTLVNALVPDADRATGKVNDATGRGRHTSTSVQALALPGGGWIVDTPGIRSFGLAHVDPSRVVRAFTDLAGGIDGCPRGCTHDEPECNLDVWVTDGNAAGERLASLRRILRAQHSDQ